MSKTEILEKLKDNLPEEERCKISGYHYKRIKDNLLDNPYEKIDDKANVISSSAAMIFNTIGPKTIVLDGVTFDTIEYERPFEVRNEVTGYEMPRPAQLDVSLLSKDGKELVLIESKFLEWFSAPKSCNKAYLSKKCYKQETGANVGLFIDSFRNLLSEPQIEDPEHPASILPAYKRYDAVQMTIHILGIYNWCVQNKKNVPENITLMNIVWNYDCEEYQVEEKEALEYIGFANLTFRNIFKKLGVTFSVEYVRYSDFLNRIDWTDSQDRRKYLRRYEISGAEIMKYTDEEFIAEYEKLYMETWHRTESLEDYKKRLKESHISLPEGAFDKEESQKRYNPRENEKAYTKDELVNLINDKNFREKWRFLSNPGYTKYAVSNLGRVAFCINGRYEVIVQDDINHQGYLKLDPKGDYILDHNIEVYKLIAMGFLGKIISDGYDVHHRINDGLNCRPENLILLTSAQHNAVHNKKKLELRELKNYLENFSNS